MAEIFHAGTMNISEGLCACQDPHVLVCGRCDVHGSWGRWHREYGGTGGDCLQNKLLFRENIHNVNGFFCAVIFPLLQGNLTVRGWFQLRQLSV